MAGAEELKAKTEVVADMINDLSYDCFTASQEAGWWDHGNRRMTHEEMDFISPHKIALIHSEVSEALEGHRKGLMDDHLPHRSMFEVELADVIVRVCDLAGAHNLDLGGALVEKMAYNARRTDHKKENRAKEGGKKY